MYMYIYICIDSVLGFRVGGFTVCDLSLELYTGFCVLGLRIQLLKVHVIGFRLWRFWGLK